MLNVKIADCIKVGLCLLILGCSVRSMAQKADKNTQPESSADRVEYAKRFLGLFSAEMEKHNFRVRLRDDTPFNLSQWLIRFSIELEPPKPDERVVMGVTKQPDEKVLKLLPFEAGFWFDRNNQLFQFGLTAELLQIDRIKKVKEEMNQHPQWSEDEAIAALERAGAKYVPREKEAFLRTLPLSPLRELFGEIHIASTRFNLRDEYPSGGRRSGTLTWTVYFKCGDDRHPSAIYGASFDPFEGRLISLGKQDSIPE